MRAVVGSCKLPTEAFVQYSSFLPTAAYTPELVTARAVILPVTPVGRVTVFHVAPASVLLIRVLLLPAAHTLLPLPAIWVRSAVTLL